jgi:hypothetical protein
MSITLTLSVESPTSVKCILRADEMAKENLVLHSVGLKRPDKGWIF